MITASQLAEAFARNLWVIQAQTAGLTHEDSLLQLPFRGNCLNWVLGHLTQHRDELLAALGAEPVMGAPGSRYRRESDPIKEDGPELLRLDELLDILARSQSAIAEALGRATEDYLQEEISTGQRTVRRGERVFFLYFHEAYHVGQTELLRQLAGKGDKVI
jgi:uncharacterized damage-inducible protein DinB